MKDIYAAITERFIEQLKQGTVPWRKSWLSAQNLVSRKPYHGVNALLLGSARHASPFWMTFHQALESGGSIRKGEKATPIIFFKFREKRDGEGKVVLSPKGTPAVIPLVRWSNVFNLQQTEGIAAPTLAAGQADGPALEKAEALVRSADLCPILHQGFAPAYSPLEDVIRIPPPERFRSPEDYRHTLFHEMTHATGHTSRLNREGVTQPVKFGSDRYSKEELIAELGAAFLSNEAGILDQVRFEDSAAYLHSWMEKFQNDPSLIVSAASHAQRSADWVRGIRQSEEEKESLQESRSERRMEYAAAPLATKEGHARSHRRSRW